MLHVTPGKATPADPGSPVVGAHFDRSVSAHKQRDNPRSAMLLGLAARDRSLVQLRNQLAGRGTRVARRSNSPTRAGAALHIGRKVAATYVMLFPDGIG